MAGLRTVWVVAVPTLVGAAFSGRAAAVAALAVAAAAAHAAGSGGGRPHLEKLGLLRAVPPLAAALATAVVVCDAVDHTLTPPAARRSAQLATALPSLPAASTLGCMVETALDGGLVVAAVWAACAARAYLKQRAAK